jgi:TRAP-type C4-dicarboxylate transport system substrate-binding protein
LSIKENITKVLKKFVTFLTILLINFSLNTSNLPIIRISVENSSEHVQTKAVKRFADKLQNRLQNRYEIKFYDHSSLFRDADIFRAMIQGKVEIGVPGTWQFDAYVPNMALFQLPSFYGKEAYFTYGVMESTLAKVVIESIEQQLNVKVFGRWLDLGHTHIFTRDKQIKKLTDFRNLKIRVAGGMANSERLSAMSSYPIIVNFADLPLALTKKSVDGLLTSFDTIVSSQLWENNLKYVYADGQYFAQYVPLCSFEFWQQLPEDVQTIIVETWEEGVEQQRRQAISAQLSALRFLKEKGLKVYTPTENEINATREALLAKEQAIVQKVGIEENLYRMFVEYMENVR